MIETVFGNIFESKDKYLCHQTNCITTHAAHLSKDVFTNYPYANIYSNRKSPDKPGSIIICGDGIEKRYIVNILGQYFPGRPKYPDSELDGYKAREKYFHQCLLKLAKILNLESIAFPMGIGCGATGGNWEWYLGEINLFAKHIYDTQNAKTTIYRLK
jgi:O-acetyl-ADP-ribose deacetylase (regulator of RNase III)